MNEPSQDAEPVVIEIETDRVEGTIDLDDVVGIVRGLQQEAVEPQGPLREFRRDGPVRARASDEAPAREVEQRLDAINRLAGELAEHLDHLSRLQGPSR